jgi:hypothetical protein
MCIKVCFGIKFWFDCLLLGIKFFDWFAIWKVYACVLSEKHPKSLHFSLHVLPRDLEGEKRIWNEPLSKLVICIFYNHIL